MAARAQQRCAERQGKSRYFTGKVRKLDRSQSSEVSQFFFCLLPAKTHCQEQLARVYFSPSLGVKNPFPTAPRPRPVPSALHLPVPTAQIGIKHEGRSTNENDAFHEKKMEKNHPVCPLPTHHQQR